MIAEQASESPRQASGAARASRRSLSASLHAQVQASLSDKRLERVAHVHLLQLLPRASARLSSPVEVEAGERGAVPHGSEQHVRRASSTWCEHVSTTLQRGALREGPRLAHTRAFGTQLVEGEREV